MGLKIIEQGDFDYDYENGRLLIWEPPAKGEAYAIGIDPAEGVGADNSVCQVLKIGTIHHPDVQVAEFACNFLDPVDFASVANTIGRLYSEDDGTEAFCTVECNAPCGDTVVNDLRSRHDYGNLYVWKQYDRRTNLYTNKLGWWTNRTTRPKLIARGLHAFANDDLIVNSPFLLDEMADFERDHFIAKAKARFGRHDDRILALLIAYWGAHDDEWLSGEDIAEERRLRGDAKAVVQTLQPKSDDRPRKPDYQSQALTYSDMMRQAEDDIFN
jgi:hypothetical protein